MDETTIIQIIGVVLSPILVYAGVKLTVKQSNRQLQETKEDNRARSSNEGWNNLTGRLNEQIDRQDVKISEVEEKFEAVREDRDFERELRRIAVDYAVELIRYILRRDPGAKFPPPPEPLKAFIEKYL